MHLTFVPCVTYNYVLITFLVDIFLYVPVPVPVLIYTIALLPGSILSLSWFSSTSLLIYHIWYFFTVNCDPYLGRLSKNVLEVFRDDIANLARGRKCIFKIGHFWALWPL